MKMKKKVKKIIFIDIVIQKYKRVEVKEPSSPPYCTIKNLVEILTSQPNSYAKEFKNDHLQSPIK